jgi:hypothetical protein
MSVYEDFLPGITIAFVTMIDTPQQFGLVSSHYSSGHFRSLQLTLWACFMHVSLTFYLTAPASIATRACIRDTTHYLGIGLSLQMKHD